jgi:hypothetical protein
MVVMGCAEVYRGALSPAHCRGLCLLAQKEPERRKSYDLLCGDIEARLRRQIETVPLQKPH